MNKARPIQKFASLRFLVPMMFLGLAVIFGAMMALYWITAAEPRLRTESETVAKAMAQFQSYPIAGAIDRLKERPDFDEVVKRMDFTLLPINSSTMKTFAKGIRLEIDPDVIRFEGHDTIICRGDVSCEDCYVTEIPLYSKGNRELLGIAQFYMSMDFYSNLKKDMVSLVFKMTGLVLISIFGVWYFITLLIRPLTVMADHLNSKKGRDLSVTPDLSGPVTIEIQMVKTALDDLLIKAKAHTVQINRAYTELKNTQAQLVQTGKLASIGELAAGVAHELNQPLMIIRAASQILVRYRDRLTSEEVAGHLARMEKNTSRMKRIINHLRTFSRQMPLNHEAVDINRVLEDALLMVSEQLHLKNILVKMHCDPALPACSGDPNQLEQVFLNLITNARDAIGDAIGRDNTAHDFTGRLDIITRCPGRQPNEIEILFKDNGTGIEEDDRHKIFDPFFSTKEVGKGTGLGLSISYGIIRDHGGSIDIAETSDRGTTLKITLKAAEHHD